MNRTINLIVSSVFLIIFFISISNVNAYSQMMHKSASDQSSKTEFEKVMRKLWEDHIVWTRNVILNIIDDLPGTDQAVERLLNNQTDIGNAVKPYYGEDAGNKLTTLLKEHITIAAEILKAAKVNDDKTFKDANKKWFDNADDIAVFLSNANPNWKKSDMSQMMNDHLKLTTDEAVARLKKDYKADIEAYDKVHEEILMMADGLSAGIIKQFPEKFDQ